VEAELKASYPDSHIQLVKGEGGIFDVKCNGRLIYSRLNIEGRRFPHEGEIVRLIQEEKG
jgi:selT/selW/selH-like putative selenoprotein